MQRETCWNLCLKELVLQWGYQLSNQHLPYVLKTLGKEDSP